MNRHVSIVAGLALAAAACGLRAERQDQGLAAKLRELEPGVAASDAAAADVRARLQAANRRESEAWRALKTRADWERYRDVRLKALRASLGEFPPPPKDLKVRVTRTLPGEGFQIENLVFESRPGLVVTANLYRPDPPRQSMPG